MSARHSRRYSRMLVAGAVSALCIGAFSACTASPPDPKPEANSSADQPSGETSKPFQEWQLKFAECMRGEGVDLPDPNSQGQFTELPADMDGFDAAVPTCEEKLGARPSRDGKSAQQSLDAALSAAECLRSEGYDVPDPKAGEAANLPQDVSDDALAKCDITSGS